MPMVRLYCSLFVHGSVVNAGDSDFVTMAVCGVVRRYQHSVVGHGEQQLSR
jgi:hypothetical protein